MKNAIKWGAVDDKRIATIKRTFVALLLLLVLMFSQRALAAYSLPFRLPAPFLAVDPLPLSVSDRQWLDKQAVLRVGIATVDYEPIDIASDRNLYQGISADYLALIGGKLNIKLQVVGFAKTEDAINALRNGTIDVITSANNFERGFDQLRLSRGYIADRSVVVARSMGREIADGFQGKTLVVIDGYVSQQALHAAYPDSEIIVAPSMFSAMEAVSQGDAHAFIGNELIARSYLSLRPYLGLQVHSDSALPQDAFSFAVRNEQTPLLALIDTAIDSVEPSLTRELLSRWTLGLGADVAGQGVALNRNEREWIARHPVVTVVSEQHPPYIYRDKNGQWVGLNIDVLNRISRLTGLQFVHREATTIDQTYNMLHSGQALMTTHLGENAERRKLLTFSYSFGGNSWVFVHRSNESSPRFLQELHGKTLALRARHVLEDDIRREHPQIKLRLVENYEEARRLVRSGEAAATIQNEAGAHLSPPDGLKVGRSVEGWWSPDRFSVIKAHLELLGILNKSLEEFPVSEMRAIRNKWLSSFAPQPSLWSRIPGWVYWLLAFALLMGLLSLAWSSRLKVQIHQRLKAEEALNDQLAFKHALLNGIPNPIYVRDLKGRLISCNRSYEENLGISFEQMNGRRLIDVELIPPEIAGQLHGDYLKLLETRQPIFIGRRMQLLGRQIYAWQWTVPFYRADGELQGLLGGWIDITERNQLERRLVDAGDRADQAG